MRRFIATSLLACALLGTALPLAAQPVCHRSAAAGAALERLRAALQHARFVTYQPTSLRVSDGRVSNAEPQSIRADLEVLRTYFDALITYDAVHGAQKIAPLAVALKFRALIIGVWNPLDPAQIAAAVDTARKYPQLVVGLSLGNETLFSHRADAQHLAVVITALRAQLPGMPLSTTEPFHIFQQQPGTDLLPDLDFLMVNVHPLFQPWFREATDATAAQFVVNVLDQLAQLYCGPILVKETGLPSAPAAAGFSEVRQASFYEELRARLPASPQRAFAYFAAFDAPWRAQDDTGVPGQGPHPEEAHWGLFDADRRAKSAIAQLPSLGPVLQH